MTAIEKKKMEKLLETAIYHARKSKYYFSEYEQHKQKGDKLHMEIAQREADFHLGFAEGIAQTLAVLLYRGDGMAELQELLN